MCGFLHYDGKGSLKFSRATNLLKLDQFHVDPHDVITAYSSPNLMAFVHSHCQHDPVFSDADIEYLNRTRIPWFIYSTKTHTFNFKRPDGIFPPFVGREFIVGLHDCAGLVMDYFLKFFSLPIPFFVRTASTMAFGYPLDCVTLLNLGFEEVKDGSSRVHDVVLMQTQFGKPITHVGVVVREGLLLHQMYGRVSAMETYAGLWTRLTKLTFRHPKFTSKLSVL